MQSLKVNKMLNAVLVTGAGSGAGVSTHSHKTFQATVVGSGAVTGVVNVEVSNNNTHWIVLGTITLSGTNSATDGFASEAAWAYYRGNVTTITGTGAALTLLVAEA